MDTDTENTQNNIQRIEVSFDKACSNDDYMEVSDENITVLSVDDLMNFSESEGNEVLENVQETEILQVVPGDCSLKTDETKRTPFLGKDEAKRSTHSLKYRQRTSKKKKEDLIADSPMDSMKLGDKCYAVGDFVYATAPNADILLLVHIQRLWINARNQRMMWCNQFLRPEEVKPYRSHLCLRKEVFKSEDYMPIPFLNIQGPCTVVEPSLFLKNKRFDDEHTYVYISKYCIKTKHFSVENFFDYSRCKRYGLETITIEGTSGLPGNVSLKKKEGKYGNFICQTCLRQFRRKEHIVSHIKRNNHYIHSKIPSFLKGILPLQPQYFVSYYERLDERKFLAKICIPSMNSVRKLLEWMKRFMRKNNCIYQRRTFAAPASNILFATTFRCHCFRSASATTKKTIGTGCKSSVYASIKTGKLEGATLVVRFDHNHPLQSLQTRRQRKPQPEVLKLLERMLVMGLQPAEALRCYKNHLRFQLSADEYLSKLKNRTLVPEYIFVSQLHAQLFREVYGLRKRVCELAAVQAIVVANDGKCVLETYASNKFVAAVLTPFMREISAAYGGKIMYVDVIGSISAYGVKVLLLTTDTNVGEMPVGVLVTSSKLPIAIGEGFELFSSLIDNKCFEGRGRNGPQLILRDTCDSLVTIKTIFPNASHFVCDLNILESTNRWLQNLGDIVSHNDRMELYSQMKGMLYASSESSLDISYSWLMRRHHNITKITDYLNRYCISLKQWKWALYRIPYVPLRKARKSKLERELREHVLNNLRTRSPSQLINFFLEEYDNYYRERMSEVRFDRDGACPVQNSYTITPYATNPSFFRVDHVKKKTIYVINADVGMCSCFHGWNGGFCNHQQFLLANWKAVEEVINVKENVMKPASLKQIKVEPNVAGLCTITTSQCVMSSNATEEFITEEVLIHVNNDAVAGAKSSEIPVKVETASVTDEQAQIQISLMADNLNDLIFELSQDPEYYYDGVCCMNRELKRVKTPVARLRALYDFNKGTEFDTKEKKSCKRNGKKPGVS